jgi:predicted dehydrogenase
LKLGLVGAGPVATRWCVPAIRAVPEVLPYVVSDLDTDRAKTVADVCPFMHWSRTFEDMYGQVDLALVAVPNHLHQPIACSLLEAGVHVLCVKPMARNVAECQRMLDSAEVGGSLLAVGHHRRFRTNVMQAKHLLAKGMIGTVTRIEAEEGSVSDWPRSSSYFDRVKAGGGALMDVGIHCVDLVRWLAGEFAQIRYSGNETAEQVESHAEVRFELEGAVEGSLLFSRDRNLRNRVRVEGTEGAIDFGLWEPTLFLERRCGKAFKCFPSLQLSPVRRVMDASFVELLLHFIRAIRSHAQPEVNGLEGMKAVEVVQWAYEGSRPAQPQVGRRYESVRAV